MPKINRRVRRFRAAEILATGIFLVAVSAALCLAGCAVDRHPIAESPESVDEAISPARDSGFARPPFYEIGGGRGATLLLLGTIHIGPERGWTLSPALSRGLDSANSFVLEVDLRAASEDSVSSSVANLVVIESHQLLGDLVSPETAKMLIEKDDLLTAMGMPENARKRLKPWFIAVGLSEWATIQSGYSMQTAAEYFILDQLRSRPLVGLETVDQQLEMLDGMAPRIQDAMLLDALIRIEDSVEEIEALAAAWQTGDEAFLEALARQGVEENPILEEFYDTLLDDRNLRWIGELRSLLDDPLKKEELIFVGVGALHLVGENGLLDLFRRAGYRVDAIGHSATTMGNGRSS